MFKSKVASSQSGFTLIELSIWLVVIGLITLPLIVVYQNYIEARILGINNGKFTLIENQINNFVANNGRYPMPASLTDSNASATFGQSRLVGDFAPCPSWPTPAGVCRTPGANPILIGAVPFADLGIVPESGVDYWGNKLLYAVTGTQTASYSPGAGQIEVWAIDNDVTQTQGFLPGLLDMLLVSHGQTGAGAYSEDGVLIAPCPPTNSPVDGGEGMNCDFDDQFVLESNPAFNSAVTGLNNSLYTEVPGVYFLDDLTDGQDAVPVDLWLQSLHSATFALTFATKIAIGIQDPDLTSKVHVVGDVLSDRILTADVCNEDRSRCFDPIHITGDEPEMDCANNLLIDTQGVMRIMNEEVECASSVDTGGNPFDGEPYEFPAAFTRTDCISGAMLMVGINASGDPICAAP